MLERQKLGTLLLETGLVSEEQLKAALAEQAQTNKLLGRILIDRGFVEEADLISMLATQLGFEYIDLANHPVNPQAAALLTDALARRYEALPIGWEGEHLVVAMADPSNVLAVDDIRAITGHELKVVVSTRTALVNAIDAQHRMEEEAESLSTQAGQVDLEEDLGNITEVTEDAPVVKLVNMVISHAVADRASDIHIEPGERDVRIRYRVDGVLHDVMRPAKNVHPGLVSRLKIMGDLDIAERRTPQDGRINAMIGGKAVDLRIATLPTVYGEKIVIRVLDKATAVMNLSDLGFLQSSLERFQAAFRKPYGTILVTGPTGSGKSTTLYATLNVLNQPGKNVITVEDPVEYRLGGINQVQVNVRAGLTFAAALRSILRCDPDIVLVGEVRDQETATIAVEAALTGHLVLTTLHTNDAASTPTRLIEMGVEPFLVASALDCIVAQRLARRLCERCKQPYRPSATELEDAGWPEPGEIPELFRPAGCPHCSNTGYRGRFAVHEVMTVTEEIERLIVARVHSEDVKKVAVAQGMLTLRQAGLIQAGRGLTSVEEVLRVVD